MNYLIDHHPSEEVILDFARGCTDEALNLILMTHFHECPECSEKLRAAEDVCGNYFDDLSYSQDHQTSNHSFDDLWDRISLEDKAVNRAADQNKVKPETTQRVSPLTHYMRKTASLLKHKNIIPQIQETILPLTNNDVRVSVMTIAPGTEIPRHTHDGYELTQIISGGFSDNKGSYNAGDLTIKTSHDFHAPKVFDDEPCICLVVRYGKLKFTGSMGLIYNSILKIID